MTGPTEEHIAQNLEYKRLDEWKARHQNLITKPDDRFLLEFYKQGRQDALNRTSLELFRRQKDIGRLEKKLCVAIEMLKTIHQNGVCAGDLKESLTMCIYALRAKESP